MSQCKTVQAAALLCLLLAACSSKKKDEAAQALPPALEGLSLVPADAVALIGVDVPAVHGSPLVQRAVGELLSREPDAAEQLSGFLRDCSVDLAKDIGSLLIALADNGERSLMVVSGSLAEGRIAACVGKSLSSSGGSLRAEDLGGRRLYTAEGGAGRSDVYFSFGAKSTLALSNHRAWLVSALAEGGKLAEAKAMAGLLARVDQGAGVWAVAQLSPEIAGGAATAAGLEKAPVAMVATLHLEPGVAASMAVQAASGEDAKTLESKAKGQLSVASLVAQKEGLGRLVSGIEVSAEGAWVSFALSLTRSEVTEILALVQRTIDTAPSDEQNPGSE